MIHLKPPAPGQKRVKEDWENIWYIGMFGSIGLASLLLYYRPDTRWGFSLLVIVHLTDAGTQHTRLGTEGGEGEDGGAWRKGPI
jgi:hypothetical protein